MTQTPQITLTSAANDNQEYDPLEHYPFILMARQRVYDTNHRWRASGSQSIAGLYYKKTYRLNKGRVSPGRTRPSRIAR